MGLRSGVVVMGMLLGVTSLPTVAATFEVPRNFEIMYVDLQSPGKFGGDFKSEVEPGQHQFVVRFNQRVGGGDDGQHFESDPYIIEVDVEQDAELELKAPYFFRKSDAAEYEDNVEFTLVNNASDAELDYDVRMLPHRSGVQQMRNYKAEIRAFTASYSDNAVDGPEPAAAEMLATEELEMLKFWFNKADAQTRKDIRIWMVDNSHQPAQSSTAFEMMTFWFGKASPADQKAFQVWLLNG